MQGVEGPRPRPPPTRIWRGAGIELLDPCMIATGSGQAPAKSRPLWVALVVALVVAVVSAGFAVLFYGELVGISPCDGGLGPGGPSCATPPFQLEQLGQSRLVDGTYSASILIAPASNSTLLSTDLSISAWNDSGTSVALLTVTLYTTWGRVLANYTASGVSWTTTQLADMYLPDVLNVTSSTILAGQYVTVADIADTEFGPFPCALS
jgi:hypothetical protein